MKPIPIKIYLVQILLVVLAASFAFLSLSAPDNDVVFWSATWGTVTHGQIVMPIVLGVVPFANLSVFFGFLFLYLLFEFYGFKMALYTSLAISLVLLMQFYLFFGLEHFNPENLNHQALLPTVPLSHLNQNLVHALAAAITLGFSTYFLFAWLIKKSTRSYFMFFRFVLASPPGFFVFVFVKTYILKRDELGDVSILIESIPLTLQFVALSIVTVIPLYVLRLLLGAFRGRGIGRDDDFSDSSKPLFKTKAAAPPDEDTHSQPPAKTAVAKPALLPSAPQATAAKIIPPTPPQQPVAAIPIPPVPSQPTANAPETAISAEPSVYDLLDGEEEITNATNKT